MSRLEILLDALLNGKTVNIKPQSRLEEYLLALISGDKDVAEPQSRLEAYLYALSEKGVGGGGNPLFCENVSLSSDISINCTLSII